MQTFCPLILNVLKLLESAKVNIHNIGFMIRIAKLSKVRKLGTDFCVKIESQKTCTLISVQYLKVLHIKIGLYICVTILIYCSVLFVVQISTRAM